MRIGAKDHIDQLLVKKYADKQVDNNSNVSQLAVSPDKMMQTMNDYASVQRDMLVFQGKMKSMYSNNAAKAGYNRA